MSEFSSGVLITVNPADRSAGEAWAASLRGAADGIPVEVLPQPDTMDIEDQVDHLWGVAERIDGGVVGALVMVNHGLRQRRPTNAGYPGLHVMEARVVKGTGDMDNGLRAYRTAGDREHLPTLDDLLANPDDVDPEQLAAERDLDKMYRFDGKDPVLAVEPAAENFDAIIEAARRHQPFDLTGLAALRAVLANYYRR